VLLLGVDGFQIEYVILPFDRLTVVDILSRKKIFFHVNVSDLTSLGLVLVRTVCYFENELL
jgi:hypothetical protein